MDIQQNHVGLHSMKDICGLKPKVSSRRHSPNSRVHPCPESKQNDIRETFKYLNMI